MEHGVTQCAKGRVGGMDPLTLAYCHQLPSLVLTSLPCLQFLTLHFVQAIKNWRQEEPGNEATSSCSELSGRRWYVR